MLRQLLREIPAHSEARRGDGCFKRDDLALGFPDLRFQRADIGDDTLMLGFDLRGERVRPHLVDGVREGIPLLCDGLELFLNECKVVPEMLNLRTRAIAVYWRCSDRGGRRGVHLGITSQRCFVQCRRALALAGLELCLDALNEDSQRLMLTERLGGRLDFTSLMLFLRQHSAGVGLFQLVLQPLDLSALFGPETPPPSGETTVPHHFHSQDRAQDLVLVVLIFPVQTGIEAILVLRTDTHVLLGWDLDWGPVLHWLLR